MRSNRYREMCSSLAKATAVTALPIDVPNPCALSKVYKFPCTPSDVTDFIARDVDSLVSKPGALQGHSI